MNPDLTDIVKRKIVSVLGLASTKASLTAEQVDNALYEYIDKSTFIAGSNIEKFNNVINLLSTPTGREEFEARYMLQQALDSKVVIEKQGTYTWLRPEGSLVIGDRYSEAVDFFSDPRKQTEVEDILLAIKAKNS